MAYTAPSDVFVPQRVGDIATEINFQKNSLLKSGFISDARDFGYESGGNTVTFPKWTGRGSGAQTLPTTDAAVTPGQFTMSSDTETLKGKIVSFNLLQATLEDIVKMANPNRFMAKVVAADVDEAIQSDIITEAETTTLEYEQEGDGIVNYRGLLRAGIENWGEKAWDRGNVLAVMHSDVVFDLLQTDEAKKVGDYGGQQTVVSGEIMQIAGKLILPLDSVTTEGDGAAKTYTNLIIARDALMFWPKRELEYNEQKKAHSDLWQLWWTVRYGVHLRADLPLGVIKYTTTSSINS
jgi:hypothetical protein